MINSIIKDYHVQSELGRGGMATVYLANHQLLQNQVAIKVLSQEYVRNENIRKRFLAEARNMASMSHPNIIKVTDLIDDGDTVAFVMEHIEGETLKEYLERKGKLSDSEIKTIFSQMLEAVGYVHDKKLVHRDIKPSNFMINSEGQVKLLDFGIAKNTDTQSSDYTQTGTSQNMGTPMYMSPEQIKSTKDVTYQSDIYSLGVVLWQMVMGKKPYDISTISTFELQTKIVTEPLLKTNSNWDVFISRATAKDIGKRFNNCMELRQILDNSTSKRGNIEEDQTILSNNDDRTIVEEKIKVKKTPTVIKKKNSTINSDSSQKALVEDAKKSSKYWHVLWILVPVLIRAIFISSDQDNQAVIPSVIIGNQEWMTENLNVETFRNGDTIPEAKTNDEWKKAGENKQPAWCFAEHITDTTGVKSKIYNWYAVNDERGLASKGWHIPNSTEWNELIDFLGGTKAAGPKIYYNHGSGFNALMVSKRLYNGEFYDDIFSETNWWSSSTDTNANDRAMTLYLYFDLFSESEDPEVSINPDYKSNGYPVRCIKDK